MTRRIVAIIMMAASIVVGLLWWQSRPQVQSKDDFL
jgi:hypothetical protein